MRLNSVETAHKNLMTGTRRLNSRLNIQQTDKFLNANVIKTAWLTLTRKQFILLNR